MNNRDSEGKGQENEQMRKHIGREQPHPRGELPGAAAYWQFLLFLNACGIGKEESEND